MSNDAGGRPQGDDAAVSREISHLRAYRGGDVSLPFPQTIEESWRRCILEYGLEPDGVPRPRVLSQGELRELSDLHGELLSIADREIEQLFARLAKSDYLVSLASPEGVMVRFRCDSALLYELTPVGVLPGSNWTEEQQGTNGVGTCLRERRPVTVAGHQHYRVETAPMTCQTAPIYGAEGAVAGVINVTTPRGGDPRTGRLVQDLIERAAIRIENRHFGRLHGTRALLHLSTDPEMADPANEGIIALDDRGGIVALSSRVAALLGSPAPGGADGLAEAFREQGLRFEEMPPDRQLRLSIQGRWFEARLLLPSRTGARAFGRPARSTPLQFGREAGHRPLDGRLRSDPLFTEAAERATRLMAAGLPLIVCGETGTGKTVFAERVALEHLGADARLLIVNCAGPIDVAGLEASLEAGAERSGRCLVLDGVDSMDRTAQVALLHALEHYCPSLPNSVPLIATTSRDLARAAQDGSFAQGLLHRLKGGVFTLAPLRNRPDLALLLDDLFAIECAALGRPGLALSESARRLLAHHHWPGNFRELRHVLRHAASLCRGEEAGLEDLPDDLLGGLGRADLAARSTREALRIEAALRHNAGNVTATARYLGISRATLYRKIEIHRVRQRVAPKDPDEVGS